MKSGTEDAQSTGKPKLVYRRGLTPSGRTARQGKTVFFSQTGSVDTKLAVESVLLLVVGSVEPSSEEQC